MSLNTRDQLLHQFLDASPPAWVVTRTRRLARELTLRVAKHRATNGREVSDTPPIRLLDDWLQVLGAHVLDRELENGGAPDFPAGRVLLSASAEQVLWERAIVTALSDPLSDLLDKAALSTTASDAWRRVCVWGEPPWSGPLAPDVEEFTGWLAQFRKDLAAGGFVSTAELSGLVAAAIRAGEMEDLRPADLVVLGFEQESPELTAVLDAMRERGTTVHVEPGGPQRDPVAAQVWRAASPSDEVRRVAAIIRERLLAQPELRIAVLAPDISAYGQRLERVFEEELDPQGIAAVGSASVRRFDFAQAPSLGDYPMIANALDLLSLEAGPISFELLSRVLLSGYPRREDDAFGEDLARCGAVEARLRRSRSAVLSLTGPRGSLARELRSGGLGVAAEKFERLARLLEKGRDSRRSPSAWRREWIARLDALAWPGALLGAAEGLAFRRWRDAMDEFAQLESVEPTMDAAHAIERLRAICFSKPVQPSSEGLSVQVMNLLDAEGLEFDVIFAIGMTATAFPASPRPNPLLPVIWQREQKGMPRASVEGEKKLAANVWARVLRAAPEVFASYPELGEAGEENAGSSHLAALLDSESEPLRAAPWWLDWAQSNSVLSEPRPDDVAPVPLVRQGGSSILTSQSNCPFRAFATVRLGAERLEKISPQPDSSRRGTLVHAALARAYRDIPSYEDLQGLADDNIRDVARNAADHAITENDEFFQDAGDLSDTVRLWLQEMVASWMRHEREVRSGPWTVHTLEENFEVAFPSGADDQLTIRFRPDRIDRVEDEALVILDFKTSSTPKTPSAWKSPRPMDAQLPLYLALLESQGHRVDGIAFANLSARDNCSLAGWGAADYAEKFRPPGRTKLRDRSLFDAEIETARASLNELVAGYLQGDARVDPKVPKVCEYCGCQALCRIKESGSDLGDEETESQ